MAVFNWQLLCYLFGMETSESPLRGSASKYLEAEPLSKLKENILATLAYYDVFDLPLKKEEVFSFLINFRHLNQFSDIARPEVLRCPQIQEIQKELDQLILDGVVGLREGYYFLFGREYLVSLRLKREKITKYKWRIARRAVWWLRFAPYLWAVFASGSLAMKNTDELSDLDVLVVVKYGRIWLARLLITAMLSILHVRRRGRDKIAPDKICLNHYITDRSLYIPHKSIYNAQTYSNLVPLYIADVELIEKFKTANTWVLDYIYRWGQLDSAILQNHQGPPSVVVKICEIILDTKLGDWLENLARKYQSRRIADNPATHQTGGRVIFTNEQLEFHPHSIETQIIKGYN